MDDGANVFKLEGFETNGLDSTGDDLVADALKTTGALAGTGHDASGL